MKTVMKNRLTPYLAILVGLGMILVASYQAKAVGSISCATCIYCPWNNCDEQTIAPAGLPTCYDIAHVDCASRSCRRCNGTMGGNTHICCTIYSLSENCTTTGETEDCGTKYKRVCSWDSFCKCPSSGGDPDGACQFQECTSS